MGKKPAPVEIPAGVEIVRLPPGVAVGAGDLEAWARRRSVGRSGVLASGVGAAVAKRAKKRARARKKYLSGAQYRVSFWRWRRKHKGMK
jgi:hypothetical protein